MEKITVNNLSAVSDTLFIPLLMRRDDLARDEPILNDQYAASICQKIDYPFERYAKYNELSFIGCLTRAKAIDELAIEFLQQHSNPIVVNAGCGLDTRAKRLKQINQQAIFYEIDMPAVIELRKQLIAEDEREIVLTFDITTADWLVDLKQRQPQANFIFVIEGVLPYFEQAQVAAVFKNFANLMPNSLVVCDVIASLIANNSDKHDTIKYSQAKFAWAINDSKIIETFATNIKLQREIYIMHLMRPYVSWFTKLAAMIPKIYKASRIAVFSIA